jgi:hypothetical protein
VSRPDDRAVPACGAAEWRGAPAGLREKLMAAVRPEFRADDLVFDPRDPVFGGPACAVAGCDRPGRKRDLCPWSPATVAGVRQAGPGGVHCNGHGGLARAPLPAIIPGQAPLPGQVLPEPHGQPVSRHLQHWHPRRRRHAQAAQVTQQRSQRPGRPQCRVTISAARGEELPGQVLIQRCRPRVPAPQASGSDAPSGGSDARPSPSYNPGRAAPPATPRHTGPTAP